MGENTTVSGYGRVDQLEMKSRDETSCRLKIANVQVQPLHNEHCKKVRFISKSLFQSSILSVLVLIPLSFAHDSPYLELFQCSAEGWNLLKPQNMIWWIILNISIELFWQNHFFILFRLFLNTKIFFSDVCISRRYQNAFFIDEYRSH